MGWTYRVMQEPAPNGLTKTWIAEVYNNAGYSDEIKVVSYEGIEELRWQLEKMLLALDKPVFVPPPIP